MGRLYPAVPGTDSGAKKTDGHEQGESEQRTSEPVFFEQGIHVRRAEHRDPRQRRHDVDITLAAWNREEQEYQTDPGQGQQEARIACHQALGPGLHDTDQDDAQRQPAIGDDSCEIPPGLTVIPRLRIPRGRLAEQDVLQISLVLRRRTGPHGQHHGHDPQGNRAEEGRRPARPAQKTTAEFRDV